MEPATAVAAQMVASAAWVVTAATVAQAALSPATEGLYARLGWRFWRGPLSIRSEAGKTPTPEEEIMFLRLPRTPPLDETLPLSAEWRPGEVL